MRAMQFILIKLFRNHYSPFRILMGHSASWNSGSVDLQNLNTERTKLLTFSINNKCVQQDDVIFPLNTNSLNSFCKSWIFGSRPISPGGQRPLQPVLPSPLVCWSIMFFGKNILHHFLSGQNCHNILVTCCGGGSRWRVTHKSSPSFPCWHLVMNTRCDDSATLAPLTLTGATKLQTFSKVQTSRQILTWAHNSPVGSLIWHYLYRNETWPDIYFVLRRL